MRGVCGGREGVPGCGGRARLRPVTRVQRQQRLLHQDARCPFVKILSFLPIFPLPFLPHPPFKFHPFSLPSLFSPSYTFAIHRSPSITPKERRLIRKGWKNAGTFSARGLVGNRAALGSPLPPPDKPAHSARGLHPPRIYSAQTMRPLNTFFLSFFFFLYIIHGAAGLSTKKEFYLGS